ncbi:MAG TPA: hypothetical protein VFT15_05520 [Chitinophagaceae bacterium]|nr:hypothetical protein [Chitinophagaceae bacterium]
MKQILFVLILGLVLSCQKSKENTEDQEKPESTAFTAERNAFFSNLMAPAEAAAQLQATGAEFNPSLMSDPKNFSKHTGDSVKAAANLGIYLSDLNYSIAYKQTATTKEYFTAAHELSKSIGGEKGTLEFLTKRYNDNLQQNDSAKNIVTDLLAKSTADLQGTEREKLAGIAMAAYQIENLHLALGLIDSYPKDMLPSDARTVILIPVFKMVLNQRSNVENIYSFLKSYGNTEAANNPNYSYYITAFEELIAVYTKLNVDEKIANNQGIELMNDSVVKELTEKVDAIRNKILS